MKFLFVYFIIGNLIFVLWWNIFPIVATKQGKRVLLPRQNTHPINIYRYGFGSMSPLESYGLSMVVLPLALCVFVAVAVSVFLFSGVVYPAYHMIPTKTELPWKLFVEYCKDTLKLAKKVAEDVESESE